MVPTGTSTVIFKIKPKCAYPQVLEGTFAARPAAVAMVLNKHIYVFFRFALTYMQRQSDLQPGCHAARCAKRRSARWARNLGHCAQAPAREREVVGRSASVSGAHAGAHGKGDPSVPWAYATVLYADGALAGVARMLRPEHDRGRRVEDAVRCLARSVRRRSSLHGAAPKPGG